MRSRRIIIAGLVIALAAVAAVAAQKAMEGKKPADAKAAVAQPAERKPADAKPAGGSAKAPSDSEASSREKYAKIAERNVFYPRSQNASSANPGQAGSADNPQGGGLLLTGIVQSGDRMYAVVENRGSGESTIVTRGESTGAGEILDATLEGITISTASGAYKIPVGYYLSGAKGPELASDGQGPAGETRGRRGPDGRRGDRGPSPAGMDASGAQRGGSPSDGGGRRGGGPRQGGGSGMPTPTPEQIEAFRNMVPEQARGQVDAFMRMTPEQQREQMQAFRNITPEQRREQMRRSET